MIQPVGMDKVPNVKSWGGLLNKYGERSANTAMDSEIWDYVVIGTQARYFQFERDWPEARILFSPSKTTET